MSTGKFYQDMDSYSSFLDVSQARSFASVPSDWLVVIADVCGSTKAIEEGRYKDVNTVGAACIAAFKNCFRNIELPYVFGGDGATLLLPEVDFSRFKPLLEQVALMSAQDYSLDLRIGVVPLKDLEKSGAKIFLAKYELNPGQPLAMLQGEGVALAEKWIKTPDSKYTLAPANERQGDILEGLSCRWHPILPRKDLILCLIAVSKQQHHLEVLVSGIDEALTNGLLGANPILNSQKRYKSIRDNIKEELRLVSGSGSKAIWSRLLSIFISFVLFSLGVAKFWGKMRDYEASLAPHSDFKKFESSLKLVLDCTLAESEELNRLLEGSHRRGEIFYGSFTSTAALLTCFVPSTEDSKHVHFVDGSDGGYAMAAKQLKSQLQKAQS